MDRCYGCGERLEDCTCPAFDQKGVLPGHGKWLARKIASLVNDEDFEYNNNYRIMRYGDPESEASFKKIEAQGCCGSHEAVFVHPDGTKYLFGFNFGH